MTTTGPGSGSADLGSAYSQIHLNTDNLQRDFQNAANIFQQGFGDLARTVNTVGTGFRNIGVGLGLALAPAIEFGRRGLQTAREFELLMQEIQVYGQLATDQMEQVRQASIRLAQDGRFGPTAVAEAFLELTKAGLDFNSSMTVLEPTLALATGAMLNLERASGIVVSALTQFELPAERAAQVADLLTQAASASRADVDTLADGLRLAGPVAHQFGLSLEETLAILAQFSQVGVDGARAGTQLRAMLLNLNRQTKSVQGAWEELGLSLYDSQGNVRNLNIVFDELATKIRALPIQEQNRLIQALAGTYGIVGFNALLVSRGFGTMQETMRGMAGATEVADAMLDTFDGDIARLSSSVQVLQLFALEPLMKEVLRPLIQQITTIVQGVTAWIQENPALAAEIVKIVGALGALAGVLTTTGLMLNAIGTALKGFSIIAGVAGGPITALVVAFGAFAAAYNSNFLGIQDTLSPFVERIKGALGAVLEGFTLFEQNLQNFGLAGAVAGVISPIVALLTGQDLVDAFDDTRDTIQRFFNAIDSAWADIQEALDPVYQWFTQTALPEIRRFVEDTVGPVIQDWINILVGIWTAIQSPLQSVHDWFVTDGLPWINGAVEDAQFIIEQFVRAIENIWEDIQPYVQPIIDEFNRIKDGVLRALQPIIDFLRDIVNRAIDTINMLGEIGASITGIPYTPIPHWSTADTISSSASANAGIWHTRQAGAGGYNGPSTVNVYVRADEVASPTTARANATAMGTAIRDRLTRTGY